MRKLGGMLSPRTLSEDWARFASHVDDSHVFHIIRPLMIVRLKRHQIRNKDLWDGSYLDSLIARMRAGNT